MCPGPNLQNTPRIDLVAVIQPSWQTWLILKVARLVASPAYHLGIVSLLLSLSESCGIGKNCHSFVSLYHINPTYSI